MKCVNFGCGGNILPGWENHDMEVDITNPLPYKSECVDMILAEHVGEHTDGPSLYRFLAECHRILKPKGKVRLCCPVIGHWMTREQAVDLTVNHGHLQVLNENNLRTFLWMAGFDHFSITRTDRRDIDGHWRVIGALQDEAETCRLEATK